MKKTISHLFKPQTWVKIENRARLEGKTPEAVAVFILTRGVGLIPAPEKNRTNK